MGLSVSLSNALSGMSVTQNGLEVVSRNVANSGTPGYHVQRQSIAEQISGITSSVRTTGLNRAFDQSLQNYYTTEIADSGYAQVRSQFLVRLESFLGTPGSAGSLDKLYSDFENSIQALSVSPDSFATRSAAANAAMAMASQLNGLSGNIQDLRQDTENQMRNLVNNLNADLSTLKDINQRLVDVSLDDTSRAALLDERDRLTAAISEVVDVNVTYRADDSVRLLTRSGVGILDVEASTFSFTDAGRLSANSLYSSDSAQNGVGSLTLLTPAGIELDLVGQGVLQSGRLGALVELRDDTLVQAQSQLDDIAAGLAQALSTVTTPGTAATAGAAQGFEVDLGALLPGNSFTLNYTESGTDKTVRVVRVDDASKLPMDTTGADGVRVIGLDFSGGIGAVAAALDAELGAGVTISNPAGDVLRALDDGAGATTDIGSLTASHTVTDTQDGTLALALFVDGANTPFTNDLGGTPQKRGFAARISINSEIATDNSLLVKYSSTSSMGDAARADDMWERMRTTEFSGEVTSTSSMGRNQLSGNISSLVSQMLSFQGGSAENAKSLNSTREQVLESLAGRMENEYGVDVDKEMAQLIQLQTAYSANARVLSAIQELIDSLLRI